MLFAAFHEKKYQRKRVLMLSKNAAAGVSDGRTAAGLMKHKPNCIIDYKYMGEVDLSDRKIYHVSVERPTRSYWKKIFFNHFDMALLNSYELYNANTDVARVFNSYEGKIRFTRMRRKPLERNLVLFLESVHVVG